MGTESIVRVGREGSRWWNQRPESQEVADWFKDVPMHEDMDPERYIGGIVLIEQKIKTKEIAGQNNGVPVIREGIENLTYTPYPKVETRVQYFWDLMGKHPEWIGVIEPVGGGEDGLPPGFFRSVTMKDERTGTRFICCSMRVIVYEREGFSERTNIDRHGNVQTISTGKTIVSGAPATKQVPVLAWGKVDDFAMMKAETGAVGRALGMAGMLVIPGAGVATAEDMREMHEEPSSKGQAEAAELPPAAEQAAPAEEPKGIDPEAFKVRALEVIEELKKHPEERETFLAWAKEKGINELADLDKMEPLALKGLVRRAEKTLDEAQRGG